MSGEAAELRDDLSYFQHIQAALKKQEGGSGKTPEQLDAAVRRKRWKAITTEGQVIDVFTAAGLKRSEKLKVIAAELIMKIRKIVTID